MKKVIELQETLQHKCGVILVGPAGSGKTVCYHTLARVLNNLHQVPPVEKEEGHKGVPQVPKMKGLSESSPSPSSPSVHRMKFKAEVISRLTLQWLEVATQGKKLPEYPAVDVSVIYPATLSLEEIIGEWNEEGNSWKDGFLTRMIRDSAVSSMAAKALSQEQVEKAKQKKPFGKGLLSSPSVIEKWMVLDGDVNQTLSDLYHPVVKRGNREMTLANGEQLSIPSLACPGSRLRHTTLCREVVQWRSLLDSWLGEVKTLWECSNTNFQLLTTLIDEIFPASLDFLSQSGCSFILETDLTPSKESLGPGLREVSTFVKILGALLSVYFKREEVAMDTDPEVKKPIENKLTALLSPSVSSVSSRPASCNPSVLLSSIFVFSYIWGFAGHLHERYWEKFEAFARHILSRSSLDIMIPTEESLFDYHVDPNQGILVSFSDKSQDRIKTMPSGYTVIPQMERYSHLVDFSLTYQSILLCGAPGVGKSALVQNLVHPKHPYTKLHFSPVFSQTMLEDGLSSKLRPMSVALNPSLASKGVAAIGGSRPMFFIDDMNCCSKNPRTGGIPNLELLRQLHSRGGYYNRKSFTFQTLEQFSFLSLCCSPTEAGRRQSQAYRGSLQLTTMAPPMMRSVIRLWCHEVTRTYTDRITSVSDMDWFSAMLEDTVEQYFCVAEGPNLPPSPSLILEEPSLCSLPYQESLSSEKIEPKEEEEDSVPRPINTSPEPQKALTSSSTSIGLPAVTTPNSDSLDSEGVQSDFHSRTLSTPGSLDKDQQPLPPIATGKEPTVEDTEVLPLKHEPHPPLVKPSKHGKQITKDRRSSYEDKRAHSPRKGVTFKPGLLSDSGAETLLGGPLITMEQLKSHDERLTDIAMSKFIATGQKETEKGYMECSSSQLEEGLRKVLGNYNEISATKMNLTFFEEALYHMARLTRVLATPGGNALLIGKMHATGRTSLVRLAAFAARCKFYTCHPGHDIEENQAKLRVVMKKASKLAGVYGKPVVMLVKSRLGEPSVQDLCSFLKEGKCPDLYTQDELNHIVSQMLPGAKQARGSRAELALDKYFNRVQTYLHVIISMDCQDGSLSRSRRFLQKFPTLMQSVISVDVYQPWSQDAYARVAEHWIQVPTSDPFTGKLIEPSWTSSAKSPAIDVIGRAMAYIHLSSYRALLQYHQLDYKVYSPATFLDFIDLFKNLMWKVVKEEKVRAFFNFYFYCEYFKIPVGFGQDQRRSRNDPELRVEVALLRPQYQLALEIAQQKQQEVELYQQEFADAKGHCSNDEAKITEMQKPLMDMKKKAQAELDRVNPVYEAALHALRSLDSSALNEIKTFPRPPKPVINVVNALCLLFGEPFGWQSGQALINRDNFFQDLEFYDKANMPDQVFHKLNKLFIQDETFDPDYVAKANQAARSLCMWLHAVYAYASIHRNMRPKISMVEEAEVKLHEAQSHLGQKRVKAQDVQGFLEAKMKEYQECLVHVQNLDRAMKALEDQIAEASHLMMNMDAQHVTWRSALEQSQSNLSTSAGDALIAAACATYHGPMEQSIRDKLNADWMQACQTGQFHFDKGIDPVSQAEMIPIRSGFTLEGLVMDKDPSRERIVSYHEGSDFDREDIRVESVSEREVEEVRETEVKGQEDEEDIPEDSTDMESSTTTGIGAEYPETPRTVTSRPSGDSETDVFSSSQQTDKISLATVQQDIPKPPLELMVVTSDDPSLPLKLCQAVVMGYTLMVTHIERAPLVDQFREVLRRNVTVGTDGVRKIAIGNNEYAYNPKFKLLLCSSVPLGMQGAGLKPLPVRDTLLINMAVDQKGLQDILMNDVLSAERPEFKNQLRSIREDVRDQRMTIAQAEEEILEKTLQLPQGVLDEESMLDSLIHYQQVVLSTEVTLQESITLQNQLLERRNPFLQVARHGTLLYRTIQKLHRLHPAYYVPQRCFQEWFRDGVRSREKDPTNIAAPRARAVELTNNLTRHVHRWMQQWCFPLHSGLFVFMFATEKMRDCGELTEEEWKMFVGGMEETKEVIEEQKPDWLDEKVTIVPLKRRIVKVNTLVWSECFSLESIHPAFSGLTKCLVQYSKQWREYFEHQPVLLAPVPGNLLANLSVFQKAVLWRIVRPDKVASICHDVTIYQLGSSVSNPGHLSLGTMLPILGPRKPLLCLLPGFNYTEQDHPLSGIEGKFMVDPTEEIEKLSIHSGLEKNFHKVTLGTPEQLKEATRLLKLCQSRGHWLLLENCQAVEKWDEHFMNELKLLLETSNEEDDSDGGSLGDSREGPFISRPPIHDNFRLFMVVDADNTNNLPGLILQHSVKRSCSSSESFKSTLQFYFSLANSRLESEQVRIPASNTKLVHEMTFSLAFFHTILSQRLRYPGLGFKTDYYWDEKDLYSALDNLVTSSGTVPLRDFSSFVEMVGTHIYGGRASNPEDLETIKSLAESVLIPWRDVQQLPSSMGVGSLLGPLLYPSQSTTRPTTKPANQRAAFQLMFDSMKENVDPLHLGLTKIAPAIIERQQSRFLITSLIHLELEPHLESPREFVSERSKISSMYAKLCEVDDPSDQPYTDNLSHLDSFVNSEIQLLSEKLKSITTDLELLGKALDGQIYLNSKLETVFQAISHNSYPQGWGYPGRGMA
ncbi:putative dynein heavy chain domain-containing protein 1 [Apostichopus japonicus]|uniref:Putative dynein heavy chain domain-containing protein 1 n=1 Tax=Stichopus japonicus TaxID=307972 RepID=A0A2G8K8A9_STIJA|nr:putative dynein heavy chain domain-containing protein 1 [Apostichopus japonicus]